MPVVKKQGSLSVQSFNRDQTERGRLVRRYRCEGPTATEDHRFKGEIHFRDEVTLEKPIIDLRAAEDGNASPVLARKQLSQFARTSEKGSGASIVLMFLRTTEQLCLSKDNAVAWLERTLDDLKCLAAHHDDIKVIKLFLKPLVVFPARPVASFLVAARNSAVKRDGGE